MNEVRSEVFVIVHSQDNWFWAGPGRGWVQNPNKARVYDKHDCARSMAACLASRMGVLSGPGATTVLTLDEAHAAQ